MSLKDNKEGLSNEINPSDNVVGIEAFDVNQCLEILEGLSRGYGDDLNQADKMGQAMVIRVKGANLIDPNRGQTTKLTNELYGRNIHEGVSNLIQLGGKIVIAVVASNFNVRTKLEEIRENIQALGSNIASEKAKTQETIRPEKAIYDLKSEVEIFDKETELQKVFRIL